MAYQVLARKWRPQLFQDVIGQEHITQTLMNAIRTGRLAHAYLFSGSRGIGKTSVARIFAKAINCDRGEPGIPCNKCRSCTEITAGNSVDVQEIDGASNRGIDEIRDLRDGIKYMPSSSRYRIYIIDEVHMLTLQAFNALLKTLEEPPAHVKFIFATTEPHKVPATILSRCQRFDFKRISLPLIVEHLQGIAKKEGVEIDDPGLAVIAREAEGSMRDAESLMDQVISFCGDKVEEKDITDILGIIDRDLIFEASAAIIDGAADRCLEVVEKIYNSGYDIKEFYGALMEQFRNLLISLIAPGKYLLDMSENDREEISRMAAEAGEEKLHFLLNFLIAREEDLRSASNPRLILEATMIRLSSMGDYLSFGELIERIASLEKRLILPQGPPDRKERQGPQGAEGTVSPQDPASESDRPRSERDPGTWDDFLAYLSTRSKASYSILKEWRLVALTEDTLEIDGGDQSFSSRYFDDGERYERLSRDCREFFQRPIRIKIVNSRPTPPPAEEKREDKVPGVEPSGDADLPQTARDLLDLFEGTVVNGNSIGAAKKKPREMDKGRRIRDERDA